MKIYSINNSLYAWGYWEKPNSCYRHFIFLDRDITLETLGNTLCVL